MSSLRPDDRSGRSGRSISRTRDTSRTRSAVREEDSKSKSKAKSKAKSGKSARFEDDEIDNASHAKTSSRGPAFDDNDDDEDERPSKKDKHRGLFDHHYDGADDLDARGELRRAPQDDDELVSSRKPSRRTLDDDDYDDDDGHYGRTRASVRTPRFDDDEETRTSRRSKGRMLPDDGPPKTKSSARAPIYADDDASVSMPTMPGGFSDDDDTALAYGDRNKRQPGLSSLFGRAKADGGSESGSATSSESDDTRRRRRKERRRKDAGHGSDVRAPRDSKSDRSSRYDQTSTTVPYPASNDSMMPQWPPGGGYDAPKRFSGYADTKPYQYAEPPEHLTYTAKPQASKKEYSHNNGVQKPRGPSRSISFSQEAEVKEVKPPEERSSRLSVGGSKHDKRAPSPLPGSRMDRLSVSTGKPEARGSGAHGAPPASPLLEAYHGTYQSISPMPSPMMRPEDDLDDLPSLSLSADDGDRELQLTRPRGKSEVKGKKKVKLYDAEGDADKLAKAMNHREAKTGPLMEILPDLTHDQLLALRDEYKKRVKVQGRGVNISKQIKATTTGNFGKICYVTALGRWESESYWANFWYQSHSSNRELLIEALMGRSNADIREINDSFKDKRYQDSLSLCMEKELKPDKFRTAILTALEGRRQEETDTWPTEYRNRDVETLHRALKSREGGESAILDIVIRRSSNHLREVLKAYERVHEANFARQALQKSNNLVGEVIAHILNGVINRPARDCLLLRHAINDVCSKNKEVDLRYELLMSRLIRLHWDRLHLARVKEDYKQKYHVELEKSVQEASKGDFGAFCLRLCET